MTVIAASTITSAKPRSSPRAAGGLAGLGGVGRLRALEHLVDVGARLRIGWHSAVPRHRPLARVVGGQGALDVAVVAVDEARRWRVPPSTLLAGSKASFTPSDRAVDGMSCMSPCAPLAET